MIEVYQKENVVCVEGTIESFSRKVYVYLVDGMLVDTGPEKLQGELIRFYEEYPVELVALTHSHEDHTGTAAWIQEHLNIQIYLQSQSIRLCEQTGDYPEYRQQTWGGRKAFQALPLPETIRSRSQEWTVISTPGHADDHVSFLNEKTGQLFSGDLFVAPKTKVIMDSESIPLIMDSLRKLLQYDFDSLFCSHSGYFENGREMIEKKLHNLENLTLKVRSLSEDGLSVDEIKQKIFPLNYPIIGFSDNQWDSRHIVRSILEGQPSN
ncbi:MBL fold metallo-hydrolase [Planococcus glaciei]|uniref:MBL fold metallo-hydrolase n=1 Tax=Planococcus glaciei TaxID=459472 RepID=A0A7H8QF31_9BACL|nr:MBL fold metallo-hydrolase [Planococcus glaciei]QDY46485.1 MBL fold metallo-hydrolase [Planococcus glaciei]QKX52081.1 MBL fold metallo-hydrolase [Planococcus glaciei]